MKKVDTLGRYTPLSFFSLCTAGLEYTGGIAGASRAILGPNTTPKMEAIDCEGSKAGACMPVNTTETPWEH